ncbi:MAG: DUF4377 domain-containing protein [Mediterranea sp.]|jgi:sugar lactone lactonase YvrE|nr:DUF4377 domain-containing protein [Mediterranea sp.]
MSISFFTLLMVGCKDGENKDWTEEVLMTVASEFVDYHPIEGNGVISNGLHIKEDNISYWIKIPLNAIEDFDYEVGCEYRLKVLKIHLANPPADGSDVKYKLIEIMSKSEQ